MTFWTFLYIIMVFQSKKRVSHTYIQGDKQKDLKYYLIKEEYVIYILNHTPWREVALSVYYYYTPWR